MAPTPEIRGCWSWPAAVRALIERFTGGDAGIAQSLSRMYREQGSREASHGMVDPELMRYVGEALAKPDG